MGPWPATFGLENVLRAYKADCSPEREARLAERIVESEVMQTYFRRMEDPVTQALYTLWGKS